jgi:hypothetical protein
MIATVELVVCSSTRKSVDKAGMAKPDMVEEGLLASLGKESAHLSGYEMCLDALFANVCDEHDILPEVELHKSLTAFGRFGGASLIC